jgi:hypothetical protein
VSVEYHISRDGQSFGPYVLADLQNYYRAGDLVDTDLVWTTHLSDWTPLSALPERWPSNAVSGQRVPPLPIPPLPDRPSAGTAQQSAIAMRAIGLKDRIAAEGIAAIPKLIDPKALAAFALFFVGSQMGFIDFAMRGMGLPGGSFYSHMSGILVLLYLLACCAFVIPLLVDRKEAWLTYWAPLLLIAIVAITAWNEYHTITSGLANSFGSLASGNPFLKGMMDQQAARMPSFFSLMKLQPGAYLMIVSAAYLAYAGTAQFLAAKGSPGEPA